MDKRKLIGTIIGVTMFAALIAGATFAWLTFNATVTNATYNGTTMNFLVNYTKGQDISSMPQLVSSQATPATASKLVIIAKKNTNSIDGHLTISLTTTTNSDTDIVGDGVVRWVICRDTTVEDSDTQIDNVCSSSFDNALNTGKITETGTINLLNDARLADGETCTISTANGTSYKNGTTSNCELSTSGGTSITLTQITNGTDYMIDANGVSYFIYFWLDSATITSTHIGQTYSGYIHASATQITE